MWKTGFHKNASMSLCVRVIVVDTIHVQLRESGNNKLFNSYHPE
jgi:hypothetical protein